MAIKSGSAACGGVSALRWRAFCIHSHRAGSVEGLPDVQESRVPSSAPSRGFLARSVPRAGWRDRCSQGTGEMMVGNVLGAAVVAAFTAIVIGRRWSRSAAEETLTAWRKSAEERRVGEDAT